MSNTDKYLYYKQDLYYILKEDTNNYYLQRCNNIFIQKYETPIHFKPETDNDYYMFLSYEHKDQYKNTKLFNKNQEDYIIVDNIDITKHKDILVITRINNTLSYEVIWECCWELGKYRYYYKTEYLINTYKHISDLLFKEICGKSGNELFMNRPIRTCYGHNIVELNKEFILMLCQISNNQDRDDILDFIDKFKKDWQALSIMASKIIEEGIDIISADSASDSDSDSDSYNDFGYLITEEDQPILTEKQKEEILLLKPLLQQDGKRRKRYFTKEEYNIGII